MKWIALILILGFSACKKCADCTRKWTYQEYRLNNTGHGYYKAGNPTIGADEVFSVCGSTEIGNEEGVKTVNTPTSTGYITGTGTCTCVVK